MISERSTSLLLFRHPPLTVLNFVQNDKNAHVILLRLLCLFVILPLIWNDTFILYVDKNDYIWSNIFGTT